MINISINQLLKVWGELVLAYAGKNKFGGDAVEIWAYQLMPFSPAMESDVSEKGARRNTVVGQSLRNVLVKFSEDFDCAVYVDGVNLSDVKIMDSSLWHVKVTPNHVG